MHNSLPVMCVLNAAEIYMAAYANLAALPHAVPAKHTTIEWNTTQTAPSGQRVCSTVCKRCRRVGGVQLCLLL